MLWSSYFWHSSETADDDIVFGEVPVSRFAAECLPADVLARGSLRGNEYAWPVEDIPDVIEAARKANMVSVGGQLQFRLQGGPTCECYWVQVDTSQSVETTLPWPERVKRTAEVGASDFARLRSSVDFLAAGRDGFAKHLDALIAERPDLVGSMCFVWYLMTYEEATSEGC